jgi:hypothetical protein
MQSRHRIKSGADAFVLAGIGLAIAAAAATLVHVTVGLTRFALFLAVG